MTQTVVAHAKLHWRKRDGAVRRKLYEQTPYHGTMRPDLNMNVHIQLGETIRFRVRLEVCYCLSTNPRILNGSGAQAARHLV
jgi:hypothetical protein